jgi:acyl-CoA reductase-like NAD-dependent aldehyde dehydrogenase
MNWQSASRAVQWKIQPFINGRYRPSCAAETFLTINPATETPLCQSPIGDGSDIDEAVRAARQRFEDGCWSELPPLRRAEVLLKLADLIFEHRAELALLDTLEMGKPIQLALYDAETFAPQLLRSWAGLSDKLFGVSAPLHGHTVSFNVYEPRGVVGAISPWNFPLVNAVYKCGPALAAGNTVVLKPSEISPSSALRLAELALEAGVPEGVLNVVPGVGSTVGSALASHPDVDMLSFTGSTTTGRRIMELAGRSNGKPLLLECGGKSPQVVFNDVTDLDAVAEATAKGILWNQGQVCSARTRLIVHEKIQGPLLEQVISRVRACRPGNPLEPITTFGPLASPAQRDRVKRYVERGLAAGAVAVLKGPIQETGGCYVSPVIFDRVETTMSIAREEIFGPVLCVQGFRTDEEAITLANGTEYGLAATVWTRDMGRSKRVARAIRAGNVQLRTGGPEEPDPGVLLSREPQKSSGFGSELGLRGLQSYSTLKVLSYTGS